MSQAVIDKVMADIYRKTQKALDEGRVPEWLKPWNSSKVGQIRNACSQKPYRGINPLILQGRMMEEGWVDPQFATFKAVKKAGGSIKKGEKGTAVILWKPFTKQNAATGEEEKFFMLRYYTVFNVAQTEGFNYKTLIGSEDEGSEEFDPIQAAENIVQGWDDKPSITEGGSVAAYYQEKDAVIIPHKASFHRPEAFYCTLFHELAHATGHKKRLNRLTGDRFGSATYAKEELVAELTANFLLGICGIEKATQDNSVEYVLGWLRKLQDDPKMLLQAAGQAQKACDMIMGVTFDKDSSEGKEGALKV